MLCRQVMTMHLAPMRLCIALLFASCIPLFWPRTRLPIRRRHHHHQRPHLHRESAAAVGGGDCDSRRQDCRGRRTKQDRRLSRTFHKSDRCRSASRVAGLHRLPHPFHGGSLGLTRVDLNDAKTVAEIQKRVKDYADAHPDRTVDSGHGLDLSHVRRPPRLPDKKISRRSRARPPCYLGASTATLRGPTAKRCNGGHIATRPTRRTARLFATKTAKPRAR